jgi:hypothetical protein
VRTRDEVVLVKRGCTWVESGLVRRPVGNGARQAAVRALGSVSTGVVRMKESGWAGVGPEWAELGNGKRAREENSWAAQDNRKGKVPWASFEDSAHEVDGNRNPLLFSNSFLNWKLIRILIKFEI